MTQPITLTDEQRSALQIIAQQTGKSEDALVQEAVARLILHYRQAFLQQARGMWRDRTDLPDFAAIRREFDRPREG